MTKKQLDSILAKLEGKKSQVSIGNIREITALLGKVFGVYWYTLLENMAVNDIPESIKKKLAEYKPKKKK